MGQDLFACIPPEIIISILSRLPVRTIMSCKRVCKSWLDLLKTPEFAKSHLPNAVPLTILAESRTCSMPHKIVEFGDDIDLDCCWNVEFNFNLPFYTYVHNSVNGLLLICVMCSRDIVVCNPITREYIQLPCPRESLHDPQPMAHVDTYGFGVSRVSGQYKVVRISCKAELKLEDMRFRQYVCQVYTVGTGLWRRIASSKGLLNMMGDGPAFLNGNLHWFTGPRISCFDLETELFSVFSSPFDEFKGFGNLSSLGDCLCLCIRSCHGALNYSCDIWLMKEYGNAKSWTKQFHIGRNHCRRFIGVLRPLIVFRNGDVLMKFGRFLCYSSKTQTIREVDVFGLDHEASCRAVVYTPSFISLRTFATEKVISF